MKIEDAKVWFDELAETGIRRVRREGVTQLSGEPILDYDESAAARWVTEAEAALTSVLPNGHSLRARWAAVMKKANDGNPHFLSDESTVDAARATFETARALLKSGRLSSLIEGIRAESVMELLDQAEALADQGYAAAAAVTAGGALEAHLRHLCDRNGCLPSGHGAIGKYRAELDKQRVAGKEIVSLTDLKLVDGWGGMRNDAAHDPASFSKTPAEVTATMTVPVRQFVGRSQAL